MLKNLRFAYRFVLVLATKKFKVILIWGILLVILVVALRFVALSFAPEIYGEIATNISKPRFIEGIVGEVDTLNPVFEETLSEREINSLVFRGLMKFAEDGSLEEDLAESFTRVSDEKYTFKLKKDQFWHDGEIITADDVVHTIKLTQNKLPTSPYSSNFKGVEVTKIDDYTVEFKLSEKFSPFILNTTLGLVPEHISLEEYKPIGSGDFRVKEVGKEEIVLESDFTVLVFKIYTSKEDALLALKLGEIDSLGGLSFGEIEELKFWPNLNIFASDLRQRQIVLFFNINDEKLKNKDLRQALALATPKETITKSITGFGLKVSETSLPLGNWAVQKFKNPYSFSQEKAAEDLTKQGWKDKELALTITTSNDPELQSVADIILDAWESVGVKVTIRSVKATTLRDVIIPGRDFQVLLSVQELSVDPDQYSIWHSSQTNEANITGLTSAKIDKILEDGRKIFDRKERVEKYDTFNRLLADEAPAIFLYYPQYFWVVNTRVKNIKPQGFIKTSDRFKNIADWEYSRIKIW